MHKRRRYRSVLVMGAVYGKNPVPLVQAMLQHGANAEAKGEEGRTPLVYVAFHNNQELLAVLLEHGVNVNADSEDVGSPLLWAMNSSQSPADERTKNTIRQLLAHGADPNLPDKNQETALQSVQRYHPDLMTLLKQAGAKK